MAKLLTLWQDRQRASADVKALAMQHIEALNKRIEELVSLRDTLSDLAAHCQGNDRPDCPILRTWPTARAAAPDPALQERP